MLSMLSTDRDFGPNVPMILVSDENACTDDDSSMEPSRIGSSNNTCNACIVAN
jgi:hypothetical protein